MIKFYNLVRMLNLKPECWGWVIYMEGQRGGHVGGEERVSDSALNLLVFHPHRLNLNVLHYTFYFDSRFYFNAEVLFPKYKPRVHASRQIQVGDTCPLVLLLAF